MNKILSSLNKAVPPRARIGILSIFLVTGAVAYFILSIIFSSKGDELTPDVGLVEVQTKINSSTELESNKKITEANQINAQINDLKKQEIENIKKEDDKSFFAGVDLGDGSKVAKEKAESEDKPTDVIDLSALFKESPEDAEKRKAKESESINLLKEDLGTKPQNSQSVFFDKQAYLAEIKASTATTTQSNTLNWADLTRASESKITTYSGDSSQTKDTQKSASGSNSDSLNNSNISLAATSAKRSQYLSRYNSMKSELELSLNGNVDVVEKSQNASVNTPNSPNQSANEEYASNMTIGAGNVMYGLNDIEIVSSEANVVRVTIAENGDTYGAVLLGSFSQINDVIALRFNKYVVENKSYEIDAIAIDAETWKSGLADDVDSHYFSRFFGVIAASLVQGYSETLSNTSSTTTAFGSTESSEKIEGFSERLQYAFGKVGENLLPSLTQNISKPSTVTIYRDKGLGIMIMSDFKVPARTN